jgi:hypothetical protein
MNKRPSKSNSWAGKSLLFFITFMSLVLVENLNAQNTSWKGTANNLWSNPANWTNGIPQAGSTVTIPWLPPSAHQPYIDINTTMYRLTMNSNPNTLTAADGVHININNALSIGNSATLDVGNATMNILGNSSTGGFINLNNGTINFLGNFLYNSGGTFTVQTGIINIGTPNTSAVFDLGGSNILNLNNGTLNVYGASSVGGSGVLNVNEGSVNFYGSSTFGGNGGINAASASFYFGNDVTISGSRQFNAGNSSIMIDGATWNTTGGGAFNPGTSTVVLTGDTEIIGKDITFYNLIVDEGADVYCTVNVLVGNDMTVYDGGIFIIQPGKTINIVGEVEGYEEINTNRPYIIEIITENPNKIVAVFNEALDLSTAQHASNYRIENEAGATVNYPSNPVLGGAGSNEVTLNLGITIQPDVNYFLITNNVKNLNNHTVSANHKKWFGQQTNPDEWIWTGLLNSDWKTNGNWSSGILPGNSANVVIPITQNNPFITNASIFINSITIEHEASLTIGSNSNLTVNGSFINNAGQTGLIIVSSTSGTGSVIHNVDNVDATFQRYIHGEVEAWHMLSSAVAAQAISPDFTPSGTYGDGTGYDLYHWFEPDTSWIYYNHSSAWNATHGSQFFNPGKGYLVSYQEQSPTKSFKGFLNNGTVDIAITKSPGIGEEFGYNLIGNPYPSSIDWKAETGWVRDNLSASGSGYDIWIWNDVYENFGVYNSASGSDYGSLGVSRYIAPAQGFFVQASQSGTISMNNSVRVHNGADNWLKKNDSNAHKISLKVLAPNGSSADEVVMVFGHNKSQKGTIKKFSFVPTAPSLSLPYLKKEYSLRLLCEPSSNPVVPVSFKAGQTGVHTLYAYFNPEHFEVLLLEDKHSGQFFDLHASPTFSFQAEPNDDPKRFVMHFSEGNFANPHDEIPARIYTHGKNVFLDLVLIDGECQLELYDLRGRNILTGCFAGGMKHELLYSQPGLIIARLIGPGGGLSRKVLIP